jgi:hypothetical protein
LLDTQQQSIPADRPTNLSGNWTGEASLNLADCITPVSSYNVCIVAGFAAFHEGVAADGSAGGTHSRTDEPSFNQTDRTATVSCGIVAIVACLSGVYQNGVSTDYDAGHSNSWTVVARLDLAGGVTAVPRHCVAVIAGFSRVNKESITADCGASCSQGGADISLFDQAG